MQALIVREPWIDMILSGEKTWEMRSRPTRNRGRIALIRQGSGQVVGVADLLGTKSEMHPDQFAATFDRHRIPAGMTDEAVRKRWFFPWILANARRLGTPVPYRHGKGPVTFVALEPEVMRQIERQRGCKTGNGSSPAPESKMVAAVQHRPARSSSASPRAVRASAIVELTEANIRYGHIYIRGALHLFPDDAVGGQNRSSGTGKPIIVTFTPGRTITTDIEGRGRFIRDRSATPDFLARSGARAGDKVRIVRTGERAFEFTLEGRD